MTTREDAAVGRSGMTLQRAMRLAQTWASGEVCTLSESEAREYHELALASFDVVCQLINGADGDSFVSAYRCKPGGAT